MVVFNTFTTPVDGIVHQQKETRAYVDNKEIGSGTLYITESAMSWCEDTKHVGFSVQYPHISLHAVRREPFPALYVMVDHYLTIPDGLLPSGMSQPGQGDENNADDEDNEEGEDQAFTELMFAPNQTDMLERMFTSMNQCQVLHPDPQDEDDDSDVYEDASELMDDDNFEPSEDQPVDMAEERMHDLNISANGNGDASHAGGDENFDPDQFADDD